MIEHDQPSKSQRKLEMAALQDIGVQLVKLNADQLAQIELPESLRDAIVEARRIRDFEGRRRQLQYIGKLMRAVDPVPIRAKLEQWHGTAREQIASENLVESWRERLLADDASLTQFTTTYPGADLQHLRSLIASIRRDRAMNQPAKKYRELFRELRKVIATVPARTNQPEDFK